MNSEASDAESKLPVEVSLKKLIGKNAEDIQVKLLTMGFTDIEAIRNTEATKVKEGNIISILINDSSEDGWYKRNDKVKIEYFEAKTDEEIALEHPDEIKIGENQKHFLGKNYQEVKEELETLGFTHFIIKEMAMSKAGWGEKEDCVAKISINSQAQFNKDTWFPEESEVTIYYFVRI